MNQHQQRTLLIAIAGIMLLCAAALRAQEAFPPTHLATLTTIPSIP